MKKKHQIKTIDDIKYCEKHKLTIFSEIEDEYYEFQNNCWCKYDDDSGKLLYYGCGINTASLEGFLYYYEEEQEQQEATEDDIGKLCLFWNEDGVYYIGTLKSIDVKSKKRFYLLDIGYYEHCHKLSPSEVAELTGYRVEEAE